MSCQRSHIYISSVCFIRWSRKFMVWTCECDENAMGMIYKASVMHYKFLFDRTSRLVSTQQAVPRYLKLWSAFRVILGRTHCLAPPPKKTLEGTFTANVQKCFSYKCKNWCFVIWKSVNFLLVKTVQQCGMNQQCLESRLSTKQGDPMGLNWLEIRSLERRGKQTVSCGYKRTGKTVLLKLSWLSSITANQMVFHLLLFTKWHLQKLKAPRWFDWNHFAKCIFALGVTVRVTSGICKTIPLVI